MSVSVSVSDVTIHLSPHAAISQFMVPLIPALNTVQSFSLGSQFLTLFCGILIGYLENTKVEAKTSDASVRSESSFMGSIIVAVCIDSFTCLNISLLNISFQTILGVCFD